MNDRLLVALEATLDGALVEMTSASYQKVLADLMQVIDANITDIRHPDDYPNTCVYCSRPAEERYG